VLVDFVQHRLGQENDDGVKAKVLPRQLVERFTLEEKIGVRNKMNFHARSLPSCLDA